MKYPLQRISTVMNLLTYKSDDRPPLICGACMHTEGLFYYLNVHQYSALYPRFLQEYRCDICAHQTPSYIIYE